MSSTYQRLDNNPLVPESAYNQVPFDRQIVSLDSDSDSEDSSPLLLSPAQQPCCQHAKSDLFHCRDLSTVKRKLILATMFCLLFACGEAVGGWLSQSMAIMSDAAHMLADFANLVIGIVAVFVGSRKPSKKYNFGLLRAEALGALMSVILIWNMSGIIFFESVKRILSNDFEIQSDAMLIAGGVAVLFNLIMVFFLNGLPHSHGHSHSMGSFVDAEQQVLPTDAKLNHHLNVRAAIVHSVGDVIQSAGVFGVSIVIKFYPDLKLLDPVCSIIFCLIVIYTTVYILRDTVCILLEGVPKSHNFDTIWQDLAEIEGVGSVHELRIWSLTSDKVVLNVRLTVKDKDIRDSVLQSAHRMLRKKHKIAAANLQIEQDCQQCSRKMYDLA